MIGGYESKIPGRIAYNSPLGQKIMTKKVGESC
jgi:transcription elongation GreA/GreB family factor